MRRMLLGFIVLAFVHMSLVRPAIGVELNYKFVQGTIAKHQNATTANQIIHRQSTEPPVTGTQTMNVATTQTVKSVQNDGAGIIETKIDSIVAQAQVAGKTFNYDSTTEAEPVLYFAPLKALIENPVTTTLTPKGQVQQITGMDALYNAAAAKTKNDIKMNFDINQYVNTVLQATLPQMPDGDVSPGHTWNKTATIPNPFTAGLVLKATYRYEADEMVGAFNCAKISFSLEVNSLPKPPSKMITVGGIEVETQTDMQAGATGAFFFAIQEGFIVQHNSNMTIYDSTVSTMQISGQLTTDRRTSKTTLTETNNLISFTSP